ncbi:MAG: hypothetical protein HYW23_00530 [Candidatus Aenigmarchaeota archaeon]|nr:hypothetical protein [Candidatus Aenigmarchaeota archaeon]
MSTLPLKLRERWYDLCSAIGAKGTSFIGDVYREIVVRYSVNRFYHDLSHIAKCIEEIDAIRDVASNPRQIEMALWFHDIIYDTTRNDNEEKSAQLAKDRLLRMYVASGFREGVYGLILVTKHNRLPTDTDSQLIADIDLASLGSPWEVFDENTRKIRKEYRHISDDGFDSGRARFFEGMLARKRIYQTDYFARKYGDIARANMQRALDALRVDSQPKLLLG